MKKFTLFGAGLLCIASAYSATYTAIQTGRWNDPFTWGVSTAPTQTLITDSVVIPHGIIVNIDTNVRIDGTTAALIVNGSLTSLAYADTLLLGLGDLGGSGYITMDDGTVILGSDASLSFAGNLEVNTLMNYSSVAQLSASVIAIQSLYAQSGTLTFAAGGHLILGNNATVFVSGGNLVLNGGTANLSSSYNVVYNAGSTSTGFEINGAGLNNLTVNIPSGNLTLSGSLSVGGVLFLTNGNLILNGYNLSVAGNIAAGGLGMVDASPTSDITISTTGSPVSSLGFTSTGNTINDFNVNVTGFNGILNMGSDVTVTGTLTLVNGSINLGNHIISIAQGGYINGGGPSSYIITGDTGKLAMAVTAGASYYTKFPIGTINHYAGASVQLNPGSSSGMFMVNVKDSVRADGMSGQVISTTQP
ncbi:MAG: hypothetical protein JWO06_3424, partial [Bacteroidota bacterium]|nr:hypothetical protein [Bacteroidota bacterium]